MPRVPQHPRPRFRTAWTALLVTLLTFPCVLPARDPLPTQEIDLAKAAVLRAETADADQYAAEALLRSRTALGQAQAALAARKTADAVGLARLAAAEADFAHARSRESVLQSELTLKRSEIADLRRRLGVEAAP
jgi:hypothetical protein